MDYPKNKFFSAASCRENIQCRNEFVAKSSSGRNAPTRDAEHSCFKRRTMDSSERFNGCNFEAKGTPASRAR